MVFASKAFPCTAVLGLFAQEGLWCDVASAGELHLALQAGFAPERIVMHGNAKSESELRMALECGVGLIVVDNFDEIDRLEAMRPEAQDVLIRVTPDVRGDTHDKISTGQADSKFGFAMADAPEAIARIARVAGCSCWGCTRTSARSCSSWPRSAARSPNSRSSASYPVWDLGGGLGVAYTADQPAPPSIEAYVEALVTAARAHGMGEPGRRLLIEPGRALVANAGVTLYTVESVKRNVSRWVAVDGGMSDNLRPMLYGARL